MSVAKDTRDRKFYNLRPGDREKMRKAQGNRDPITGAPLSESAHCDHCHRTGLVRGLLNPMTNKFLVDDPERLRKMLDYVTDPPAPKALGEKVYGLIGRAQNKKIMKYGPDGSDVPHLRSGDAVTPGHS